MRAGADKHDESHGACTVVMRDGHILAITRGWDLDDLALPGGKLKKGESFGNGALRELREETGVDASQAVLLPVAHRRNGAAESVSYLVVGRVRFPAVMRSEPFEGFVRWATPQELLCPRCTYSRVNRLTFQRLGLV